MISVGTNVFVRILIDDPDNPKQNTLVRERVVKESAIFISKAVQLEVVWLANSVYGFAKKEILILLDNMRSNFAFHFQDKAIFEKAIEYYRSHNVDFSDCMILVESQSIEHLPLITFDKKLSKLPYTKLLS